MINARHNSKAESWPYRDGLYIDLKALFLCDRMAINIPSLTLKRQSQTILFKEPVRTAH